MKSRLFLFFLILMIIAGSALAYQPAPLPVEQNFPIRDRSSLLDYTGELDEDDTIFFDDFEGDIDWISIDQTSSPAQWRTSDYEAWDNGVSWWCGDPDIPGYDNSWLQFLNSPVIDLSDAEDWLFLSFMLRYGFESGDPQNPDYDGWDGCNVWISVDGGDSWDVLQDPSVPYDEQSLYSFGLRGMGTGIPGWSGISNGWIPVEFDLSDYAGFDNVMIRFAVATDNGVNSRNNPNWVSMIVDDILITDDVNNYLENDAEDVAIPGDFEPQPQGGTGITFELQTDEVHSPDNAWQCENGEELFSRLISPPIEVPGAEVQTFVTYWVYCDWPDSDGDGDNTLEDYYQIEVLDENGHFEMVGYDYGYDGSDEGWVLRTDALMGGERLDMIDLTTNYAGQTVQIAFRTVTDDNQDGGVGSGLFIDDFAVISTTGRDNDVAVDPLFIPFPTTVNRLVPATCTFRNIGNNPATFVGIWYAPGPNPFAGQITLEPQDSTTLFMDFDPEDEFDGLLIDEPGDITMYARAVYQADEFTDNNQTDQISVTFRPEGEYELGYDDRNPQFMTTRFGQGEGPMTHFTIPGDLGAFSVNTLRVLWNGDLTQNDEYDFDVHFYAGGDTPGEELFTETYTVTFMETNPNWQELDVAGNQALQNLQGDFWVWFELTDGAAFPHIVFSDRLWGADHHYDYDGTDVTDANADWMIRVVGEGAGGPPEQHFQPVPPTGRPYAIIVDEALINDQPLQNHDEIGFFDGDLCVGAGLVDGDWPMALSAWEGDPANGLEGFTAGNTILYKLWISTDQMEYDATATYVGGHGNGTFGFGAFSEVELEGMTIVRLTIPLAANYFELISTNIVPADMDAHVVYGQVEGLEIVYQDDGHIYIPPAINTIGDITITEGYQVYCSAQSEITYTGAVMDPTTVYDIYSGRWNWIGYPFVDDVPLTTALEPILDEIDIVMVDDGRFFIPPAINTIGNMTAGEGYFIFVQNDVNLVYNHQMLRAAGDLTEPMVLEPVENGPTPTGLPWIVLVGLDHQLTGENPAFIEIYDGDLLVGKSAVLSDQPQTPVVTWHGAPDRDLDGFENGHPMRIDLVSASGDLIVSSEKGSFGEGAYASLTLDASDAALPGQFAVDAAYPNPFNPTVTVPFSLPQAGEVQFTVFNTMGQRIAAESYRYEAGNHRFTFDAASADLVSGIYVVQVRFNGMIESRKVLLLK